MECFRNNYNFLKSSLSARFNKKNLKNIPYQKTEVLIIDDFGYDWIKECLPSKINQTIVPLNSIPLIFNLRFILLLLKNMLKGENKYSLLCISIVETLAPKVIITFQDNINLMSVLHEKFKTILVISAQNGLETCYRKFAWEGLAENNQIPIYYGFGDYERDLWNSMNKINCSNEYIKAGSL